MDTGNMNPVTATTSAGASATSMAIKTTSPCKISMLWNWDTMDSCFISESWHITSNGIFAASCLGVILLVMSLEFLRRIAKVYDKYLSQHQLAHPGHNSSETKGLLPSTSSDETPLTNSTRLPFRPSMKQQAVRATFHMLQFAVAYFVMLLAMYYNGFVLLSICIGAWFGSFVFSWETINLSGVQEEATLCCG
ncbi:Ctr-domain-containing protein [Stipitochalara longipes BDJ]|nr:Ctr-domain-containing protein [Stipitochalara longipes BDJ]